MTFMGLLQPIYKNEKVEMILVEDTTSMKEIILAVIWARHVQQAKARSYYDDYATKNDGNILRKPITKLDKLSLFGDLQLRNVHYKANGAETEL
jgi:iron complex outermembrane receptor protein